MNCRWRVINTSDDAVVGFPSCSISSCSDEVTASCREVPTPPKGSISSSFITSGAYRAPATARSSFLTPLNSTAATLPARHLVRRTHRVEEILHTQLTCCSRIRVRRVCKFQIRSRSRLGRHYLARNYVLLAAAVSHVCRNADFGPFGGPMGPHKGFPKVTAASPNGSQNRL